MSNSDELVSALEPVAKAHRDVGVSFFVGGSVASSFHGASRSTLDVDVVADFDLTQAEPFLEQLGDEYYRNKTAILDAISRRSCFNLIHYPTSFKVDVFVSRRRPFDIDSMKRAQLGQMDPESDFAFPIASPEDTILSKLEWYRLGNEVSERQWGDVVRVLEILGEQADYSYMNTAAQNLGVQDLLERLIKSVN